MKVLIAVVMFLFGAFVGFLLVPMFNELASSMYVEEEYSTPRIKTVLRGFGITLPVDVSDINMFLKQDGQDKQVWLKFECSSDVRDAFVEKLTSTHFGHFNREVENPKMSDGTPITWWTYSNSFRYYEFKDMCAAYDEVLRNFYLYAVSSGDDAVEPVRFPVEED